MASKEISRIIMEVLIEYDFSFVIRALERRPQDGLKVKAASIEAERGDIGLDVTKSGYARNDKQKLKL